jgi:predicted RNA-binding protein
MRASFLIMRRVLHILTRPDDALARELMARQKNAAGTNVEAVDLTQPEPDYKALLGKIFQAESVESW